jgi:hypothetical protein
MRGERRRIVGDDDVVGDGGGGGEYLGRWAACVCSRGV